MAYELRSASHVTDFRDLPLFDQRAGSFTLRTIGAPVSAVAFMATRCGILPANQHFFRALSHEIGKQRIDARLVIISTDPEHDRHAALLKAASQIGAFAPRFRLASGNAADIAALLRVFDVRTSFDHRGVPNTLESFVYVLDGDAIPQRAFAPGRAVEDIVARLRAHADQLVAKGARHASQAGV